MARLFVNFAQGTLAPGITAGATTATSPEFEDLPVIAAPDYLPVTLDPQGAREIVHITAHSASSDTVTITRGQEGSTAAAHAAVAWARSAYADDFSGGGGAGGVDSVAGVEPTAGDIVRSELVTELQGPAGTDLAPGNVAADKVTGDGITDIVRLTQAAYDALNPPDPETLYVIVESS
jgi:hypothetical protein